MTATSTPPIEHPGFLAAIEADPADPTPKLILADWLEDRGEHELAAAWRWCGEHGRHPRKYDDKEWTWFFDSNEGRCKDPDDLPEERLLLSIAADLPEDSKMIGQYSLQWADFPSLSAAVAALASHLKEQP